MAQIKLLEIIEHLNIIKILESKITSSGLYLIFELSNKGNLAYQLKINGTFTLKKTRKVTKQILSALFYLQEEENKFKYLQREVKLKKILEFNGNFKLSLFNINYGININKTKLIENIELNLDYYLKA